MQRGKPTLGVNVTRYIDSWLSGAEKVEGRTDFFSDFAKKLVSFRTATGVDMAIFTTQVMDHDCGERLVEEVAKLAKEAGDEWRPMFFSNKNLSNHEILSLANRCELFIGMRLHSLIIAARAQVPVLGLVYAPKVRSFLKQLNTPEYAYELNDLSGSDFSKKLQAAWEDRKRIYSVQRDVVRSLEERALNAGEMLEQCIDAVSQGEQKIAVANS